MTVIQFLEFIPVAIVSSIILDGFVELLCSSSGVIVKL